MELRDTGSYTINSSSGLKLLCSGKRIVPRSIKLIQGSRGLSSRYISYVQANIKAKKVPRGAGGGRGMLRRFKEQLMPLDGAL